MRVLVTGGAGFIGSHIVDRLVADGHDALVVDVLHPAAHDGVPADLAPGAELVVADLGDPDVARSAVAGVDAVCHQAAMVGLGVDFADVGEYVRQNDLVTAVLLRALHERGGVERLVLASSMVVYGEGRYRCGVHGVVRPGPRAVDDLEAGRYEPRCPTCGEPLVPEAVTEDAPVDPRNVYATTKLAQEHLCASFAREHPTTVTALRYHNVYGPRMPRDTPYAGVASIFRSALEAGSSPRVFEDGGQLRDFVHVEDVARANVLALTADEPVAGAVNVASGEPRSVGDMARALAAGLGRDDLEPEVVGGYRLGDVRHVFASPSRAAGLLAFRAAIGFDEGMRAFATAPLRTPSTERG